MRTNPLPRRFRLAVEILEERSIPAVAFLPGPLGPGAVNLPALPLGPLATVAPQAGKPVVEPTISVNPSNPEQVVVSAQNGLRASTNSGGSFSTPPTVFGPAGFNSDGDTSTVFDSQGRLFWTNLDNTTGNVDIEQINPQTGAAVPGTFAVVDAGNNDDKEVIAVDPRTNNLYVVWTDLNGSTTVFVSSSVDQGQNWSPPVAVSGAGEGFVWPSTVAVGPDGTVYVAYHSVVNFDADGNPLPNNGQDFVARYSNDLSTLISKTTALTNTQADTTFNVQATPAGRVLAGNVSWAQGSGQPWVLPDPVRPGNVYVVGTNDPTHSATNPTSDVVFARSTSSGAAGSWAVSTIATGTTTSFRAFPTAFIDPYGDIFVAWYADTDAAGNLTATNGNGDHLLNVFATYSTDGDLTWAAPFQVNDPSLPFDPDVNASFRFAGPPETLRIGEYFGIAAVGNTAYLAWNGNTFAGATPTGQQVYYAAFGVNGSLGVTGDDGGVVTNDTVILRREAANPAFLEIVVNGQVQYAGLMAGLNTLTVNGLGGSNTLVVDCTNGDPIPPGGLTYLNFQNVQNINCPLVPTATTLTSSAPTSGPGQPVTFTAVVTPSSQPVRPLTGSVSFFDGATLLATVPLTGTVATLTTASLAPGAHTITAVYSGDAFYQASTSPPLRELVRPPAVIVVGADAGTLPEVKVYDAQTQALKFDFFAYPTSFRGGVRVAVGDVNGDGIPDIVTGAGPGAGPQVNVYDGRDARLLESFYGLPALFTGGVFVAVGDVNGDGFADVIAGADAGGGPLVNVYDGRDGSLLESFYAFPASFTGGVRVAAGDTDGDGRADIITGAGPGGLPQVSVFSGANLALLQSFFAFPAAFRGGVFVSGGVLDGSGLASVVVGAGAGGLPQVNVYGPRGNGVLTGSFFAADPNVTDVVTLDAWARSGVRVGTLAPPGAEVLAVPGPGPATVVNQFAVPSAALLDRFFAFDPTFHGGAFVAGGKAQRGLLRPQVIR